MASDAIDAGTRSVKQAPPGTLGADVTAHETASTERYTMSYSYVEPAPEPNGPKATKSVLHEVLTNEEFEAIQHTTWPSIRFITLSISIPHVDKRRCGAPRA
jgi:hypothetical protein